MDEIKKRSITKWSVSLVMCCAALLVAFLLVFYLSPSTQMTQDKLSVQMRVAPDSSLLYDAAVKKQMSIVTRRVNLLDKKLDNYLPHKPYIIVNTTQNKFYLYSKSGKVVREGFCSSGSYTKLVAGEKEWIFHTPRGRRTILSKAEHPVWSKPDWAFIEDGLPVPPPGDPSRFERGVLGKYKLTLGDGYLIHGTLYQRLLGMPVTHGCIRLGDDDLEAVYKTLEIGSYVYIY